MNIIEKIREVATRRALHRKIQSEMAAISDAELRDLDLSYARITEMSRQQAYAN